MTLRLRKLFRKAQGPLDLDAPVDAPPTMVDWKAAYANGEAHDHEDSIDRLNADRTWGTGNPAEYGGSGISLGYSCSDIDAVLVAEEAVYNTKPGPDLEHHLRRVRYAATAWDMTHDEKYKRRLVVIDNAATGSLTDDPATIHLNDPGWVPQTLAQYHAMSQQTPHVGVRWNGRLVGEVAWGRAMRMKVDPTCPTGWSRMLLDTCERVACTGTGQQVSNDGLGETSTFHEGLLIHGVLANCYRLGRGVPSWVLDLMDTIETLPRMDFYGLQSPIRYWRTIDGVAVPSERSDQQGDPGLGYFSSNCVALAKLQPNHRDQWLRRAAKMGPNENLSEDTRKLSMLWRGAVQ